MMRIVRTLFGWTCMMTVSLVIAFLVAPRLYSPSAASTTATSLTMKANAPNGTGYWMVGSDGGVFAFGTAKFYGSLPEQGIHVHDIVGIVATPSGNGYFLMGADGSVYPFGDARRAGDARGKMLGGGIVGAASVPVAPANESYSAFETGMTTNLTTQPKTAGSIQIHPRLSGNLLVEVSGEIQYQGASSAEVTCQPELDGKAIGVRTATGMVSSSEIEPEVITVTGASQVLAGRHQVTVVCSEQGEFAHLTLDGFAIVTPAG